jgi:glycosyltransferase involved in cell wall biosynthesis
VKVLHVITGLGGGGAEAALFRLVTKDSSNTHYIVSLSGRGVYASRLEKAGVRVVALELSRNPLSLARLSVLWRLVREFKPDVMQTWMYHADFLGGVVACFSRVPVVWGIRQTLLVRPYTSGSTIAVARACALMSKRIPAAIVSCSSRAMESHIAFGYKSRRMVVIPNGYDLGELRPMAALRSTFRREIGVPEDTLVIGMVARLDPTKDHSTLLAACKYLRRAGVSFHLVLVGARMVSQETAIAKLVAEAGLGGSVSLLGFRSDIAKVMNGLDIHVLSSMTEAFPNVLAEAMACGTPCVTTDAGDSAQIVGDAGWVVPPGDPERLANALMTATELFQCPQEWQELRVRVRERMVTGFRVENMVQKFSDLWAATVARSGEVPGSNSRMD